jgi:hypothetical protein
MKKLRRLPGHGLVKIISNFSSEKQQELDHARCKRSAPSDIAGEADAQKLQKLGGMLAPPAKGQNHSQ